MTESLQALLDEGQELLESYELIEAEAAFQKAIDLMPDTPEVYLGMARLQLLQGQPEKAREWAEQAASIAQNTAESNAMIASCDLQLNRVDEAVALLKRTQQWNPDHPLVLSNLGKAYAIQGRYADAKPISQRALELGAAPEEVEFDLGNICGGLEEYEEAVEHFVASIEANPHYIPPYIRLSEFAKLLGMIPEAIEILEDGVGLMPDMFLLREQLYVLYMMEEKIEESMGEAMALAERRGWAEDYLRFGNTALLLGDMESAKVAYETALEADPDEVGAFLNLGHWYRIMKQRDAALDQYRLAAEKDPDGHKSYLGFALTYMELDEDFRKARLCLMKAVEIEPQSYDVLIHLATCSLRLDEKEEAETYAKVAFGISTTPREQERAVEIIQQLSESE